MVSVIELLKSSEPLALPANSSVEMAPSTEASLFRQMKDWT